MIRGPAQRRTPMGRWGYSVWRKTRAISRRKFLWLRLGEGNEHSLFSNHGNCMLGHIWWLPLHHKEGSVFCSKKHYFTNIRPNLQLISWELDTMKICNRSKSDHEK
jgi:hypothetical protein